MTTTDDRPGGHGERSVCPRHCGVECHGEVAGTPLFRLIAEWKRARRVFVYATGDAFARSPRSFSDDSDPWSRRQR